MARLIASDPALRALLLLSQRGSGMRTSDVANALGVSYTGAEKALDILVTDGLASESGNRYSLAESPRSREALRFACAFLRPEVAVAALARGNEEVEFAGIDREGVLIVFRRFATPGAEIPLRDAMTGLGEIVPDLAIEFATKEELRETLLTDLAPRRRAAAMTVLSGSIERTFPDRTKHGDFDARPLGQLNEAIRVPSARRLRDFARQHGLRRILAFGSATRADFRPDSDLDLLVEPADGRRLGLAERIGLIGDAERLFDRDVDVLTAPVRRPSLAERIRRDGVVLYDAAR